MSLYRRGFRGFLKSKQETPQAVKRNLGRINKQVLRMQNLIIGILEYSRVESEKVKITTIMLKEFVQTLIEDLSPPPEVEVNNFLTNTELQADEIRLRQVFHNLISNAIKHHHAPQKAIIEISFIDLGKHYEFSVKDNGPGIDKRFHERVLRFFRL